MLKEQALAMAIQNAENAQHQLNAGCREWGLARMQLAQVWANIAEQLPSGECMMQPPVVGENEE